MDNSEINQLVFKNLIENKMISLKKNEENIVVINNNYLSYFIPKIINGKNGIKLSGTFILKNEYIKIESSNFYKFFFYFDDDFSVIEKYLSYIFKILDFIDNSEEIKVIIKNDWATIKKIIEVRALVNRHLLK